MQKRRNCYYKDCEGICIEDCKGYTYNPDLKMIVLTKEEYLKISYAVGANIVQEEVYDIIGRINIDNFGILNG